VRVVCCRWKSRPVPGSAAGRPYTLCPLDQYLPPEILDHIVNSLHDNQEALRECCLVSKSWIPRTRKHLFAQVDFRDVENLQSWKETFPDPLNSPGCYTHILHCSQSVVDAEAGDWITNFSRVVYFGVDGHGLLAESTPSFVPFHGFSPVIKSLRAGFVTLPASQVFDLILSFPLLENLFVVTYFGALVDDGDGSGVLSTAFQPSNPPPLFTGTLDLSMRGGMEPITHRLLSSPGGIHFQRLNLKLFHERDLFSTIPLLEGCSYTLKYLSITYKPTCTSILRLHPHR